MDEVWKTGAAGRTGATPKATFSSHVVLSRPETDASRPGNWARSSKYSTAAPLLRPPRSTTKRSTNEAAILCVGSVDQVSSWTAAGSLNDTRMYSSAHSSRTK